MKQVQIYNRKMAKRDKSEAECKEMVMSPAQREVFIVIDEWWKKFGYSPSYRDIAYARGKMGMGNTKEIIDRLVALGVLKRLKNRGRTVRPVYINFKNLE